MADVAYPAGRDPHLKVGFILAPDFTLLAFTGFIEPLRQAADVGDRSRPIWCSWSVMSHDRNPITSSCGLQVAPWEGFRDPSDFDYIVLAGGLLGSLDQVSPALISYIRQAVQQAASLPTLPLNAAFPTVPISLKGSRNFSATRRVRPEPRRAPTPGWISGRTRTNPAHLQ